MLTEKQELEYMEQEGLICPHCGGSILDLEEFQELDNGMIERSVKCNDCNNEWSEVYSLFCITDDESTESQLDKKDRSSKEILQMPIRSAKELTDKPVTQAVETEIITIDCEEVT